jgi:phospholipase/carboxylesterase
MSELVYRERPATGKAAGLLILHHGRGMDEQDLLPLADVLDPRGRLHVVTPRASLTLSDGQGYHWYLVPRVGYPDRETFRAAYQALATFREELWRRFDLDAERTALGGFSMGSAMNYALGLGPGRPAPTGILAFSGFIPTVDGWEPQILRSTAPFIAHGHDRPDRDRSGSELAGAPPPMTVSVKGNPEELRYGLHVDGELARLDPLRP